MIRKIILEKNDNKYFILKKEIEKNEIDTVEMNSFYSELKKVTSFTKNMAMSLFIYLIKNNYQVSLIEAARTQEKQTGLYEQGRTLKDGKKIKSAHQLGYAVDISIKNRDSKWAQFVSDVETFKKEFDKIYKKSYLHIKICVDDIKYLHIEIKKWR